MRHRDELSNTSHSLEGLKAVLDGTSFLRSSTSMETSTSSPTNTPPVSRVLLYNRPKSLRLSRAVAEAPRLRFPHRSLTSAVGPSTQSTISLVAFLMVKSPVTFSLPLESCVTCFDLKVIDGYFSTSKNSALFKWASLLGSRVLIIEVSMVATT